MSTDTAAAPENDFAMEMLDQCRFYVEGVALLPVSIIGIIGNKGSANLTIFNSWKALVAALDEP